MSFFKKDGYGVPIVLAVGLHLAILLIGVVTINFSDDSLPAPKRPPIVHATVVDISKTIIGKREAEKKKEAQQQAEIAKQKELAAKKKAKELAERKAFEAQKKQLAQAKKAQEQAIRKAEAAAKAKEEAAAAKKKKEQEIARQKQLADQRAKEKASQKAAEEKKRQEEAKKKAQAAEEAKRQKELERQKQEIARKAEQERLAKEAARQAKAKAEAEKKAAQEAKLVQSISGLINNRIAQAWIRPPNARNNMKTKLQISFLPTGEVQNVQVVESSGDALFDQRAVNAARNMGVIRELSKVDPYVFERNFRNVVIIFNPQDLRN
ncbi:hypothetical protein MSP8887_03054 [Marinomonas spartinae]|uniref:cell envelope integrity protein TolA n=1 Tax=Marinomonas spartinae TaxID=1792290 RepID=UPI000808C245|nr:cell envelope integrity protein TolA [Marinomonas spartinae]SBS37820.1 hypothetical protein MSP8887_03054 [Marinomonas spartinae]